MERRLFLLQRLTAMALAPLVLVHLGLVLVAIRGGLTAGEILARTQGSVDKTARIGRAVPKSMVPPNRGYQSSLKRN